MHKHYDCTKSNYYWIWTKIEWIWAYSGEEHRLAILTIVILSSDQKDLHGNKNYADAEFLVAKMDLTNEDAVDKA